MARYGKLLLQKMTFQYCDWMGSSQGMREFVQRQLPGFVAAHPHVAVATVVKRSRFPSVTAEYAPLFDARELKVQLQRQQLQQLQQPEQHEQQQQQPRVQHHPHTTHKPMARAKRAALLAEQQRQQQLLRHNTNTIGVKHQSAQEIRRVVWWLTQSQGRRRTHKTPNKRIVSRTPSIQGAWTPTTFMQPSVLAPPQQQQTLP